jgi:NAD(P)-dependent dehydrogenase (short-subunit alcohol dehydrogenase family)
MDTELRDRRRRVTPLGTEGTPWDVAWAAVFLASDESRWISGVTIPVDGGVLAEQPLMGYEFISEEVASADTDG